MDTSIRKRRPNLKRILDRQAKVTKSMTNAVNLTERSLRKRDKTNQRSSEDESGTNRTSGTPQLNFVVEKVSERHVRKYGATSCVVRAHMEGKPRI